MMILAVNNRDAGVRMLEVLAERESTEPRPEHNHMGQLALHEFTLVRGGRNSKRTKVESARQKEAVPSALR